MDNDNFHKTAEPNTAVPDWRIITLRQLKSNGVKTWVSFEPVINPIWTICLMDKISPFADAFKVGKLNHNPEIEKQINWAEFLKIVVKKLRYLKKPFYIKKDLAKFDEDNILTPEETDMDFLNLKPWVD
jgi:DNA repair photolyase